MRSGLGPLLIALHWSRADTPPLYRFSADDTSRPQLFATPAYHDLLNSKHYSHAAVADTFTRWTSSTSRRNRQRVLKTASACTSPKLRHPAALGAVLLTHYLLLLSRSRFRKSSRYSSCRDSIMASAMAAPVTSTASTSLLELYPIVIPPIKKRIGAREFTISCEYLEHNRNLFDSKVETALAPLQPVLTRAGKPQVHQPHVRSTTLDYWRSQCIFRGLSSSGTKAVLQQRIRDALASPAGDAMTVELKCAQAFLIREFRFQNATKRDEKRTQCTSVEARAEADAKRFLRETSSNATKDHAVVVKSHRRMVMHQAAETIGGLCTMSANAPVAETGRSNEPDRWIVIANSRCIATKDT